PYVSLGYLDIEEVRKYKDMRALLNYIHPDRLRNALKGPMLDIVEDTTEHVLAWRVPKMMLILICGRPAITKFLRTLEREDGESSRGAPVQQELRIPRGTASHVGFRIMLSWMKGACYEASMGTTEPIRVPKNLFTAISLARTLDLFGLHRDACRVDNIIADHHFRRPIYPDEIAAVWKCLPRDNKYLFGIVNVLRERIKKFEDGKGKPLHKGVLAYLEENSGLSARVRDPEVNEQFKPFFGTKWCEFLGKEK
ncbi:hypothetical protein K458DRAFT_251443, partial [Lentithecium fluviatile CBS 122367]